MVSEGDLLAGRYRIGEPLGAGGMATVHRARDLLLGREVALKILAPNVAVRPTVLERFGREARALAALSHPNIVAIHDVGWADESTGREPFLVMELVPGGTLAQRLATHGRLAPAEVVGLVDGLASALTTLHRAGIVHRDVKPQNVLLSPVGPKLADLGVIRLEDEADELAALTASGETLGTLRYLSPEVLYGQAAGPKADAFGLALVAFEALTGRSPRPAVTLGDLVDAAWQPPPLVSEMEPSLGTAFDAVFAAGLDLDPNRRLDALGFATALRKAAGASGSPGGAGIAAAARGALPGLQPSRGPTFNGDDAPTARVATTIASARDEAPGSTGHVEPSAPRRRDRTLAVAIVGVIAAGLLLVLYPRLFAGTAPQAPTSPLTGDATSSPMSSASPSPSPTTSPSASPTPSPSPSPESLDAAFTVLRAAISSARGDGGLKGGDAKDLERAVDAIERAVASGDMPRATTMAGDLANEIDKLIQKDDLGDATGERLREASSDLLRILESS